MITIKRLAFLSAAAFVGYLWLNAHWPVAWHSTDQLIQDLYSLRRSSLNEELVVVNRLAEKRDHRAVRPLVSMLQNPWPNDPFAESLRTMNPYEEEDFDLKGAVADALGSLGALEAVAPLLNSAKYQTSDVERQYGARVEAALTRIGPSAIPALSAAAMEQHGDLRCAAVRALTGIRDEKAVQTLASVLSVLDEGYTLGCNVGDLAAKGLVSIGELSSAALVRAAGDSRSRVREPAICSLVQLRSTNGIPVLISALEIDQYGSTCDKNIGDAAMDALMATPDASAARLVAALPNLKGKGRDRALAALIRMKGANSVPALQMMLAKGNSQERVSAATALGAAGEPGLSALLSAVRSPSTRRAAIVGLGRTRSKTAVQPLLETLHSGGADAEPAKASLAMLGSVSAPDIINLLDDPTLAPVVFDIFMRGHMPSEGADALLTAHKATSGRKHYEIARILSEIGERRADDALWAVVHKGDFRVAVELNSFLILTGSPEAEKLLIRALDGYGNTDMALTLLNSGNNSLENAAEAWARRHGYRVNRSSIASFGPRWGAS